MQKILFLLSVLFLLLFTATNSRAQGVGAGGFEPYLLGVMDTCSAGSKNLEMVTDTVTLNFENIFYPVGVISTNPFPVFNSGAGNGNIIDGNFWNIQSIDSCTGPLNYYQIQYLHNFSLFPVLDTNCDSISFNFIVKVKNTIPIDTCIIFTFFQSPNIQFEFAPLDTTGNVIAIENKKTILANNYNLLGANSFTFSLVWSVGSSFELDGAELEIITYCRQPPTPPKPALRVLVENCEPIVVEPACLTQGTVTLYKCMEEKDTIFFSANTVNKIEFYYENPSSAQIGIQNLFTDFEYTATNGNVFTLAANPCQLITSDIAAVCSTDEDFIITTR